MLTSILLLGLAFAGHNASEPTNQAGCHIFQVDYNDQPRENASLRTTQSSASASGKCPFMAKRMAEEQATQSTHVDWNGKLRVDLLGKISRSSNAYGEKCDYPAAFLSLNYNELKADIRAWMNKSQDWWPADYGNYAPQVVRMTWHSAATYRIADGRGGLTNALQRFLPLSSWEDNGNIDKTRRLLWPIKQKYGDKLSWSDLIALAGNVALESMGVKTVGFGGGRCDPWESDFDTYVSSERLLISRGSKRWTGFPNETDTYLENPLTGSKSGFICANPEGPGGNANFTDSAREIRETFQRMGMNDEETVALIAGGHTFGKSHGSGPSSHLGPAPDHASIEHQGLGWINTLKSGNAEHTITNGCEGSWVQTPTHWDKEYLHNLLDNDFVMVNSPAGCHQWTPVEFNEQKSTPDAHIKGKRNPLMMFTSDLALKADPEYNKILRKFRDSPKEVFFDAFAEAWFKLIHRDMGPKYRYLGPEVNTVSRIWQDPLPAVQHPLVSPTDVKALKKLILESHIDPLAFARVAWASAASHRVTDKRGGANGARIRLAPMKDWDVNRPEEIQAVVAELENIRSKYTNAKISMADLIVLAGNAAIEQAAKKGGTEIEVPFVPGRTDATEEMTDVEGFKWLKPAMDGFRNYEGGKFSVPAEFFLIDHADLLGLSAPQLTALIGGMRTLNMNWDNSTLGVLTNKPGTLSNDFFVNLLDLNTKWIPLDNEKRQFRGVDRTTQETKWHATRCDLIFGSDDQLRVLSEIYGSSSGSKRLITDFIKAWNKIMMLDRYDIVHAH